MLAELRRRRPASRNEGPAISSKDWPVMVVISAVLSHCGPTPLDSACRRIKPAARPRAWHPPTSEPQTCRACRHELPASHFSMDSRNKSGRNTHCRACCAERDARRMAALPMPRVPQTKECLLCREELPAAAFDLQRGGVDGLQSYCRKCDTKRAVKHRKERAPSQLPPPPSIVCAACREEKPLSAGPEKPLSAALAVCVPRVSTAPITNRCDSSGQVVYDVHVATPVVIPFSAYSAKIRCSTWTYQHDRSCQFIEPFRSIEFFWAVASTMSALASAGPAAWTCVLNRHGLSWGRTSKVSLSHR